MTALRMSADGRAKLIQREGFETKAYKDSVGVWTIGVGHTAAAGPPKPVAGMEITRAEVDKILSRDLRKFEDALNAAISVPLTQGQFDALCSFAFNVGIGAFQKSTLLKKLNRRDYRGAASEFMKWVKPPELFDRRESEQRQFIKATYAKVVEDKRASGDGVAVDLTAADLRAAGSRTMDGTSQIKKNLIGLTTSVVGSGATVAVNQAVSSPSDPLEQVSNATQTASNIASNVQSIHEATQSAPAVLGWLHDYWPHLLIGANVMLAIACVIFVWRIFGGVGRVERAKVDDVNADLVGGE